MSIELVFLSRRLPSYSSAFSPLGLTKKSLRTGYEHSKNTAANCPLANLAAASSQTLRFQSNPLTESGPTSPKKRSTLEDAASVMKNAVDS